MDVLINKPQKSEPSHQPRQRSDPTETRGDLGQDPETRDTDQQSAAERQNAPRDVRKSAQAHSRQRPQHSYPKQEKQEREDTRKRSDHAAARILNYHCIHWHRGPANLW
jgi:hypothetical protein